MVMDERKVPPNLHLSKLNPHIDVEDFLVSFPGESDPPNFSAFRLRPLIACADFGCSSGKLLQPLLGDQHRLLLGRLFFRLTCLPALQLQRGNCLAQASVCPWARLLRDLARFMWA